MTTMKHHIENRTFDEERALYAIEHTAVTDCLFDGPADGESALKEARDITVAACDFRLRYPLWHVAGGQIKDCTMTETCRAALWYASDMTVEHTVMGGIKALRECDRMTLRDCTVRSDEFGWRCRDLVVAGCRVSGEYPFFGVRGMAASDLHLDGKYSFQYLENATIRNAVLNTKDALWHARGVTVEDSVIRGQYLAWYAEDLTLVRCHIESTQPLCYCKNLTLVDCTMEHCDLAFENSTVSAAVIGRIDSVRSPAGGSVVADEIGEIFRDGTADLRGTSAEIAVRGAKNQSKSMN